MFAAAFLLATGAQPVPAAPPPPPPRAASAAEMFSIDDYPAAALRSGEQGTTRFRVAIGRDGKPRDCVVTGSSGSSILDSTTCRLFLERARFAPARDSAGRPVEDSLALSVTWALPD
jgi:protein TonB